jgi:glycosyltransferase involved in cell wall biosynthesis
MEAFQFYLALTTLFFWLAIGLELFIGNRSLGFLRDIIPARKEQLNKISIIVPARNEERNIREALQSMLQQDYSNLEFIIINDRSADNTTAILEQMQKEHPRLQVHTITDLPRGWLGKNHALQCGAEWATGEILLFTDADIVMQPDTVSRAASCLHDQDIDHLCIMPNIRISGRLMGIFIMTFGIFFWLYAMPWRAADPKSKRYIGIGGFNMIRADVYRAIGMHQPIALRPDDDMKLGKLIKMNGYHQKLLHGESHLSVEWYRSVRELIDGLMKNAFAGVDYSVMAIVLTTVVQLTLGIWPFIALVITGRWVLIVNSTIVLTMLALWVETAREQSLNRWYGIGCPLGILMFIYILWRAMILNIKNDGITWRGTHYSLKELKANKI